MADFDPSQEDPRNNRLSQFSRRASFWVLLGLVSILLMMMWERGGESAADFSYTEFREQLDAGNVLEVTVVEGTSLEGELRSPHQAEDGTVHHRFVADLPGEISESLLTRMEEGGVVIRAEPARPGWGNILIGALPWLLLIAFWIWIFRTMQSGGNKAFQFGRSKAKLISPDKPQVTFADVAGADEAKEELQEIIEFLKDPQKFSRLGGRLPKGVLLVGPPGTGKTFTIAALVASLTEAKDTVLVTSHTHAAVEQALWALVEHPSADRQAGFLYEPKAVPFFAAANKRYFTVSPAAL